MRCLFFQVLYIYITAVVARRRFSKECDITDGAWIQDDSRPVYKNCSFIRTAYNCGQNGRSPLSFEKWSWKPSRCIIPKFSAAYFLKKFRKKKVAFIGDSMNSNVGQSLICQLSRYATMEKFSTSWEGVRLTGVKAPRFRLEVYFINSPFLVNYTKDESEFRRFGIANSQSDDYLVFLDYIDPKWSSALHRFDLVVFMSAHWFLVNEEESVVRSRNFIYRGRLQRRMTTHNAYKIALNHVKYFVLKKRKRKKSVLMYLTHTPSHYSGGKCTKNTPMSKKEARYYYNKGEGAISKSFNQLEKKVFARTKVKMIDVSFLASFRQDAHVALNYGNDKRGKKGYDCLHWCLGGLPDIFVDVLQYKLRE